MKWSEKLPEKEGVYVWRDDNMFAPEGGPVGGLVRVVECPQCCGWPCKDGKFRKPVGSHVPFLTKANKVYWLRLKEYS